MPLSYLQLHGTDGSLVTFTFHTQWSCKSSSVCQAKGSSSLVSCLQLWPKVDAWGKSTRTRLFLVSSCSLGFLSIKLVSLPSLWMLLPLVTWQKPDTHKLLLQCDATLSSREACSAALPPWLCKVQMTSTFRNET